MVVAVQLTHLDPTTSTTYLRNVFTTTHSSVSSSLPFNFKSTALYDFNPLQFSFLNNITFSDYLLSDPDSETEVLRSNYVLYVPGLDPALASASNSYPVTYTST